MMYVLLVPILATFILFIIHYFQKQKKPINLYIKYYIILFFASLLCLAVKSIASEPTNWNIHDVEYYKLARKKVLEEIALLNNIELIADLQCGFSEQAKERINEEISFLDNIECLTESQRKDLRKNVDFHLKEGHRCFNAARGLCTMIPKATDQKIAEKLFETCVATAAGYGVGGYSGAIAALVAQLVAYSLNYFNEYQQMQTYLNESKYHYEMCAFYKEALASS